MENPIKMDDLGVLLYIFGNTQIVPWNKSKKHWHNDSFHRWMDFLFTESRYNDDPHPKPNPAMVAMEVLALTEPINVNGSAMDPPPCVGSISWELGVDFGDFLVEGD